MGLEYDSSTVLHSVGVYRAMDQELKTAADSLLSFGQTDLGASLALSVSLSLAKGVDLECADWMSTSDTVLPPLSDQKPVFVVDDDDESDYQPDPMDMDDDGSATSDGNDNKAGRPLVVQPPRKRGRPRNFPPPPPPPQSEPPLVVAPLVIKRGRGRPRKIPRPMSDVQVVTMDPALPLVPKRGRGRPRKNPVAPSPPKPDPDGMEEKMTRHAFAMFPPDLMDLNKAGALDIMQTKPEVRQPVLEQARRKFEQVHSGQFKFGHPVVIPSFEHREVPFILPTIISNIIAMNVLVSQSALDTRYGKVSVFPVTVFTTAPQAATGRGGYPCLALHVAHFKVLCWRVFSACRKIVNNATLLNGLMPIIYKFKYSDDHDLTVLAGMEQYTNSELHAIGGFILLPAQWFDVMKNFFVSKDGSRHDIGDIFRAVYAHIPGMRDKFQNEFRVIWLGGERTSNVNTIIRLQSPFNDHTFSMTRCRAASGVARVGHSKAGNLWVINPPKTDQPVQYTPLTFCYGVQCWREQLQVLNSACIYFTATSELELQTLPQPRHMSSLLVWEEDPELTVKTRAECIAYGIHNDMAEQPERELKKDLRNARAALARKYGKNILLDFFGLVVSTLHRTSTARTQQRNQEQRVSAAAEQVVREEDDDVPAEIEV